MSSHFLWRKYFFTNPKNPTTHATWLGSERYIQNPGVWAQNWEKSTTKIDLGKCFKLIHWSSYFNQLPFYQGASRKFKRWGHPIPPLGAPGPQSWRREQYLEVLKSVNPIYNGVLCIFIKIWKFVSRRISRLRGSWELIFHQSIVLVGTSNPANMSFLRLL